MPGGATCASVVGAPVAFTKGCAGIFVERDAQADLDLPAGDFDLFDDEAEQALAAVEVESVDPGCGRCGEVA